MRAKKILQELMLGAAMVCCASAANASLVGDSFFIKGCFPNLSTCGAESSRTVDIGSADQFAFGVSRTNVEADSVLVTVSPGSGLAAFNGVVLRDLNWVGEPGRVIVGFSLLSNNSNFDSSKITFGPNELAINLGGLGAIEATITLQTSVVPLPPALGLLGAPIAGLALWRSRRRAS